MFWFLVFLFSVCSNSIFVFVFFFRCKASNMLCVWDKANERILRSVLQPEFFSFEFSTTNFQLHIIPFWHKRSQRMRLYRHIEYLAKPTGADYKAGGRRKNGGRSILPFYLFHCCPADTCHLFVDRKQRENIWSSKHWYKIDGGGGGRGRDGPPICLESIWAKRVPNKQIRLSLITISQTGGAA